MTRKRRSPWGSITEVRKGAQYTLRYTCNTAQGRTRKTETVYGTYNQATLRLAELRVKHSNDKICPTIGQAFNWWYWPDVEARHTQGKLSQNTYNVYSRVWNLYCSSKWSNVPLDSVRPLVVQEWLNTLTHSDAKNALVILRGIEKYALNYEVIEAGKFSRDYRMPEKSNARSKDVYTFEQANLTLDKLHGYPFEGAFILACFGGARTGESLGVRCNEITALQVRGLNFAAVPIVRQMGDKEGELSNTLKNEQSKRTALIPGRYGSRLLEVAQDNISQGIEWLTPRPNGLPMSKGVLNNSWRRTIAGANHIPFANLRPSWRTFAAMEWCVPSDVLELLMGHKLPGVTGAHYMRPSAEQLADQMAAALLSDASHFSQLGII